jgi:D-lactate dehydrogenase (cytochrome)
MMQLSDEAKDIFNDFFGERFIQTPSKLTHYAASEAYHQGHLPSAVIKVKTTEDVQFIMRHAHAMNIPVTPWGVGTSLEGNAAAVRGGIMVDFSEMNTIKEIATDDMFCVIEPGVTREELNRALKNSGLFFPVDPGANATLGGMIATRASGTTTVKYGSMRDHVLALKIVMPNGALIQTGMRARKSAAGYDLTHLFTGSEGTLGLIVEATLRLHGRPEHIIAAVYPFDTLEGAIQTVITVIQMGIGAARLEFLDEAAIDACNRYNKLSLALKPTLFIECHGDPLIAQHQISQIKAIGDDFGGGDLQYASVQEERQQLWKARHTALNAAKALKPRAVAWITDICVPISHLGKAVLQAQDMIKSFNLTAPIVGHVGDGNYHVFFILDEKDEDGWAKAKEVNQKMIDFALSVGGTCTGEHGIGLGKRDDLVNEHGESAIDVMRLIKTALDPKGIMNPHKIFKD